MWKYVILKFGAFKIKFSVNVLSFILFGSVQFFPVLFSVWFGVVWYGLVWFNQHLSLVLMVTQWNRLNCLYPTRSHNNSRAIEMCRYQHFFNSNTISTWRQLIVLAWRRLHYVPLLIQSQSQSEEWKWKLSEEARLQFNELHCLCQCVCQCVCVCMWIVIKAK